MIFTERTITVVNDSATINKPLILYRGDKNIELKITIAESQFKFRNNDASNVIETTDASYAQLVINTPYGSPIFSDVAATKNGAVIFVISAAMIDEIREVGAYEIQIRLLDDNKQSRASIPPVSNAIEIREPIAIEDGSAVDSNAVNVAKVNRALTTTSAPLEAFDSQGNYIKKTWGDGDPITDAALNKMEAGIDGVNKKIGNVNNINDTTASATTTYSSNKIETIKRNISSQIKDIENLKANNPEVVQARGEYALLNDRLNANEYINKNTVKNLAEDMVVSRIEGDAEIISCEKNILTVNCPTANTKSSLSLGIKVKKDRRYIFLVQKISDYKCYDLTYRVLKDTYKLYRTNVFANAVVYDITENEDGGVLTFAFRTDDINVQHKFKVFVYEDKYHSDYLIETAKQNIEKPLLYNNKFEADNIDIIKPIYKYAFSIESNGGSVFNIPNCVTLKANKKYFIAIELKDTDYIPGDIAVGCLTNNTWNESVMVTTKALDIYSDNGHYFTGVINPLSDFSSLGININMKDNACNVLVYLYDIPSEEYIEFFNSLNNFGNVSFIKNSKLSHLKNDMNLYEFNKLVPFYDGIYTKNIEYASCFYTVTKPISFYADKKYYISIEVDKNFASSVRVRTLSGGVWANDINILLNFKEYNNQCYYEGFFSPSHDFTNGLTLNVEGATVGENVKHAIKIYDATNPSIEKLLLRNQGHKEDILNIDLLSTLNESFFSDIFAYLDHKVTTRTTNSADEYFQATNKFKMSKDKLYYLAIDWKEQPLFNYLWLKTITGGVWDNKINTLVYPRYTNSGTYYECYFSPKEDIENVLYLNISGGIVGKEYTYDVYLYEIENEMQEYALRMEYGFLSPSIKLANTSDRHFRGKKISALGDSLTAFGSGGHYLQFMKNMLGFKEVAQCGIGGTRVSGTGDNCFWQDSRVNTLMIDSDYILIKGGTNDAPYINLDETVSMDNCDTNTFVGAYNVLLSKIYYKYLKLDTGYYASKGIDYSGVTQVDIPKDIKIYLITPPKSIDGNIEKRQKCAEIVKKIGLMWGIPVVDANGEMQMNPFNYPSDVSDKVHYPLNFHYNLAKLIVGKMRATDNF